jgi:hypothetical protein
MPHPTIGVNPELARPRHGVGSNRPQFLCRPKLVHIQEALAEICRHIHLYSLVCIHNGIVRLLRLYNRSVGDPGTCNKRRPIETERGLAYIRDTQDRRGVRDVGDVSYAEADTSCATGVGNSRVSTVGGDADFRVGVVDADDGERLGAGAVDVLDVA